MRSEKKPARSGPAVRRSQVLRVKLLEAISEEKVEQVAEKLSEAAVGGNMTAIKLFLEYAAGRPAQAREVSARDPRPASVDWEQARSIILEALSTHPEVKIELAAALDAMSHDESVQTDREDA